ncbi:MAG TPA: long-chain fatty acid--CoA ligase [Ktedonosporobacter sp.]|jgi:long-chain acyl-CoA synthetase|nr:long-chain fatty acid--CoA ligase [Ktedonosporobacter sp.]
MSDPSLIPDAQANDGGDGTTVTHPWFRHYEQGVPTHIDIPNRPLTWLLDETSSRYPNHTAIIYYGTKITYAQLSNLANRFAIGLQRLGVKKGDRVAIALPNIPQYPIAFYGALRAGAVVVPTNPLYTKHEMQHQMADSGARVLVMLDSFYPVVREVRDETALEHIIITSPGDYLPPVLRFLYPLSQRGAQYPQPPLTDKELHEDAMLHSMQALLQEQNKGSVEAFELPVPVSSDDLAVLQYTGGTTGLSKGAMLTHRNLLSNALQTRAWVPNAREGEEIALCVAPFFHSYGLTVGMNISIHGAATMVLLPRFKAKDVLNAIRRFRPTLFPGIPTMYIAIMREAGKHAQYLSSIKYCISGAAPLPAKVQSDFEQMSHGKLVEGYGLSEASPVTHCNPLTEECRNGSIGLPLPDVEAAIIDGTTGAFLSPGEVGEIVVKGPNIMQGYWKREDETRAIFFNGWMHTGDIGKMDEDGYFYVVERAKDLIIASGFNVYPREVEEVLFQHPAVLEAAVAGAPDEYRGETVAAFVVLKPGYAPTEETKQDILTFCKQELTPYKVPKHLEFRESLPKSLIGKVLRRELHVTP